jgi:hypothetical protein
VKIHRNFKMASTFRSSGHPTLGFLADHGQSGSYSGPEGGLGTFTRSLLTNALLHPTLNSELPTNRDLQKRWEGTLNSQPEEVNHQREAFAKPRAYDLSRAKDSPFDWIGAITLEQAIQELRIDSTICHIQSAVEAPILKNR